MLNMNVWECYSITDSLNQNSWITCLNRKKTSFSLLLIKSILYAFDMDGIIVQKHFDGFIEIVKYLYSNIQFVNWSLPCVLFHFVGMYSVSDALSFSLIHWTDVCSSYISHFLRIFFCMSFLQQYTNSHIRLGSFENQWTFIYVRTHFDTVSIHWAVPQRILFSFFPSSL